MDITLDITSSAIKVTLTATGAPLYFVSINDGMSVTLHNIETSDDSGQQEDFIGVSLNTGLDFIIKLDIRNIEGGTAYATAQDLYDAILAVIP